MLVKRRVFSRGRENLLLIVKRSRNRKFIIQFFDRSSISIEKVSLLLFYIRSLIRNKINIYTTFLFDRFKKDFIYRKIGMVSEKSISISILLLVTSLKRIRNYIINYYTAKEENHVKNLGYEWTISIKNFILRVLIIEEKKKNVSIKKAIE